MKDGDAWLIGFGGEVIRKYAAPLSRFDDTVHDTPAGKIRGTSVYKAEGMWVRLVEERAKYLAIVTEFAAIDRSVFYVYDQGGDLVYQEVLPEGKGSIAVLSSVDGRGREEVLVGGEKTIWRYKAK